MTAPIVMLAQDGPSTRILYRAIQGSFPGCQLILEPPVPRREMILRRWRKLGTIEVIGQLIFLGLLAPMLRVTSRKRISEIKRRHGLDDSELDLDAINVPSVNSEVLRNHLKRLRPSVIVVNGTRIIGPGTLECIDATFINIHAGITPRYRGVHGGYWALAEGKPDLAGSTVHLVDQGIDTGGVLAQATFRVTPHDNFVTYPYLHTGVSIPILLKALGECLEGEAKEVTPLDDSVSRLRFHPTAWFYLWTRLVRGIR